MASLTLKRKLSPGDAPQPPSRLARDDQPPPPVLRTVPPLPEELWWVIDSHLIPASPLLPRDDGADPRFPVADAMRDLRSLSLTCNWQCRLVARLRKSDEHLAFRAQASQEEYEYGNRSDEARKAAQERYDFDPAPLDEAPLLLRLGAFNPEQWHALCHQIQIHAAVARDLRLNLREAGAGQAPQLAAILHSCPALRKLSISSNASLPDLFGAGGLPPALKSLRLQAQRLAPQWLAQLAQAPSAAGLQSLVLAIPGLTPAQLSSLASAAPHLSRLRSLSLPAGLASMANCEALAAALAGLCLERLDLGRDGGICAKGALLLLAAVCAHPTLSRLGLHQVDDPDAAPALFTALKQHQRLEQLAYTGALPGDGFSALWDLMREAPRLHALSLDGCSFNERQLQELARAVAANGLRELSIANQDFTDAGAARLADAIRTSTSLKSLAFSDCGMSAAPQAHLLAVGVAKSKSLLALELRFSKGDKGGGPEFIARAFARGVCNSGTLVHFDLRGARCEGWAQAQESLKRNRVKGARAI